MKYIVLYNDSMPIEMIPENRRGQVLLWKDLLELGQDKSQDGVLDERLGGVKPGTCCTLVYTSGTTG
jgi:long-chain acyl-CoA synthetase